MLLKCGIILLSFYTFLPKTYADQENDQSWDLEHFIDFNALSYEDACEDVAKAEWKFINDPTNANLLAWEQAQGNYSSFKKKDVAEIHNQTAFQSQEDSLEYQLSVEEKPGDTLLNSTEWKELVSFSGKAAILRMGTNHTDGTENHSRREIEEFLSGNAKVEDKRSAWSSWHRRLLPHVETFASTLRLVSDAAKANDADTVANYWELLSGYTYGYDNIRNMWGEIIDLHKKLITFVQNRLSQKYKIKLNDATIPAYLLGSLDGDGWTSIAADVIPYGNVSYSIIKSLWEKNLRGITLYRNASAMGKSVLKDVPTLDFWKNSKFNQTCSTRLINFCRQGATRVLTCHQASVNNYLTAHKVVAKVVMGQMKAEVENSHFVFNMANRYSGLDEGVSELFSILSVSPGQLVALDLIDNHTDTEHSKITSLMITALDVIPRLAYYMSADLWRLDVIKNGTFTRDQLLQSWWEYRERYEGVTSESSDIPTFLDDDFITSNKPYLPKFVGTILAFQLYRYLTDSTEVRYDAAAQYPAKRELISMIQDGGAKDWMKMINNDLGIYDVSAGDLTSYFSPLVEYLENNAEDIYSLTSFQEADLHRLEDLYGSVDVTTPTPTFTPKNPILPPKKSDPSVPLTPPVIPTEKPTSRDKDIPPTQKTNSIVDEIEEPADAGSESASGINTSKAVWAVSVVLVATITICIIAIFGRRRCIKSQTPKNRRYV